jgi:hypothetical protein
VSEKQEPVDVTTILLEFFHGVDTAFEEKSGEPVTLQAEQAKLAAFLAVAGRFLSKTDPPHAEYLFVWSDILDDLRMGIRHPLLRTQRRRSPSNPTQVERAKANVAIALDALIALGERPENAARAILVQFPRIKSLAGPKSHRPGRNWHSTILEWRKTLSAPSRKKNDLAAETFAIGRELIKKFIEEGRQAELKARALGRAKYAELTAVFLSRLAG